MKALISPNEPRETGYRVAEVEPKEFDVAEPLFWVDCADDVVADQFWFDPQDQSIKPNPQPEPEPEQIQE
jgi:sucrose-6-phosphate hydrolase SacC (GH32 family)